MSSPESREPLWGNAAEQQGTPVFIAGFGNTGTRLIVRLLREKSYCTPRSKRPPNSNHQSEDLLIPNIRKKIKDIYQGQNSDLILIIQKMISNRGQKSVFKSCHFMIIFPQLKKIFPTAKFIVCVRNPLDLIFKGYYRYNPDFQYFKKNSSKDIKLAGRSAIKHFYKNYLRYADLVVKLEDMLFDTENTIRKLYETVGCDTTITPKILSVIGPPSKTVGKGVIQFKENFAEEEKTKELLQLLGYKN